MFDVVAALGGESNGLALFLSDGVPTFAVRSAGKLTVARAENRVPRGRWVHLMGVLDAGGRQAMHNHANSFISGIVYLTPTHPGSQTVFMKSPGGHDFVFKNDHKGVTPGEFSADKWVSPAPEPGDMILFPSYLLHAVPPNQGERRITLSFNAIPAQLDSWGYVIRFGG